MDFLRGIAKTLLIWYRVGVILLIAFVIQYCLGGYPGGILRFNLFIFIAVLYFII